MEDGGVHGLLLNYIFDDLEDDRKYLINSQKWEKNDVNETIPVSLLYDKNEIVTKQNLCT